MQTHAGTPSEGTTDRKHCLMLIYGTDFAVSPNIVCLHLDVLFTSQITDYLPENVQGCERLLREGEPCVCRGLSGPTVTCRGGGAKVESKRSLTQAARLGGPISVRMGMDEVCVCACACVCVLHILFFSSVLPRT